ncbi:hypothetical protein M885DRAFT_506726 [Pelagophyceae sp. CCMP2097]|nr:hypothetical protein M885DRAFT_506726 [Pelagophyceae sp. CCMP2097]
MGAGASSAPVALSDDEKAHIKALNDMTPELRAKLAVAAMKDVLGVAVRYAVVERGRVAETWRDERCAIPVPEAKKFESLAAGAAKHVPLVGGKIRDEVLKAMQHIADALLDCAVAVCADPETVAAYEAEIAGIGADEALAICGADGDVTALTATGAFSDYLIERASARLAAQVKVVVATVLKTHKLTKLWQAGISAYNAAAARLPKAKGLQLDLNDFVVQQCTATINSLIRDREAAVRLKPPEDASDAVKAVFGAGVRQPAELICHLVLVPRGDPRAFFMAEPCAAALQRGEKTRLETAAGLAIVSRFEAPRQTGAWSYCDLGIGQPEDRPGLAGLAPLFFKRGPLLVCDAFGATKVMDVACGRYHKGNRITIVHSMDDDKYTFWEGNSRDFVCNEDRTISPATHKGLLTSAKSPFVLGIIIVGDVAA